MHLPRGARAARKYLGAPLAAALLLVLGAFATPTAAGAAGACAGEHAFPNGQNSAQLDAAALCLMNQIRAAHRLPALHHNSSLQRIASGQASDMVRGHYFGDQSLTGQSPLTRIMASAYVAHPAAVHLLTAQNIGYGTGPNATPRGIVLAWMQSPPHRKIILTAAYRDAGVGVAPSVPSGIVSQRWLGGTYAVEFGTRRR